MVPLNGPGGLPPAAGYDPLSPPPPPRGSGPVVLWRFLRWMLRTDPASTVLTLLARLITGLVPAAVVWIVRHAFADAVGVYRGTVGASHLLAWVGAWAGALVFQEVTWRPVSIADQRLKEEMEDALARALQRKAAALRLEVFERADFYDILGRARQAATPGFFLGFFGSLFGFPTQVVTLLSVAAVVGAWSPWLLAATVVAAIPNPVVETVLARAAFFLGQAQSPRLRLRTYLGEVLTSRDAAKEVRTYGLAAWLLRRWDDIYWSVADEVYGQQRAQGLAAAALRALGSVGLAGALAFAAWGLVRGSLSGAEFAAMLVALKAVQEAAFGFVDVVGQSFGQKMLRLSDLFVYLDLGPEETRGGAALGPAGIGDITLEGVSFRYPQRPRPALRDVSFTVRAGERIALVGENGSGKTTLVKVLTGLYRPTSGRVLYGGRDLAGLDMAEARALQAAVFQDHIHYALTLRENIGLGRAERMDRGAAVEAAAARGGADAVAAALPDGYATMLTRLFDGGTELSGGQWQRVAVSRGFMRESPLIVLDEPTAALDPKAEADVFRRFAAMAAGRTAVLVSHRLGFARLCDRVLVLVDGTLAEQGPHDNLLAAGGVYAGMWAVQAGWYQ